MRYCILVIFLSVIVSDLHAFRVRGSVGGIQPGEWVYLYTDAPGDCCHKWQLSLLVDSVKVERNGAFEFDVQNVTYGRLWLLRTKRTLIHYFFSADEDYEVSGVTGNVGLKTNSAIVGCAGLLAEDIMSRMEITYKTPVEKRQGIEWLKRFVQEDAGIWALAYYYSVVHDLEWREVEEVLPFIPERQRCNPYVEVLRKYHAMQGLIQPGKSLALSTGKIRDGQDVASGFAGGHPSLIYAFMYPGPAFENMYVSNARNLMKLTSEFPDLRLILAYPEFADSVCNKTLNSFAGERILIAPLETLMTENTWMDALGHSGGMLLVDGDGKVLTHTRQIEELRQMLTHTPYYLPHYEIDGYVEGLGDGVAELVYANEDGIGYSVKDTALITNGYFRFEGVMKRPEYCNIGIRNTDDPVGFWLDNDRIDVHIRAVGRLFSPEVRPSLNGKIYGSRLENEYQKLLDLAEESEVDKWITAHADEPVTLFWMAYVLIRDYPLKIVEKWFGKLDKGFRRFREYQQMEKQFAIQNALQPGKMAPLFTLVSPDGRNIALESFRGKYVLLDFWASWCGPCRAEIPHLKKLWKDWHNRGLEILSIAIDQKKKDWLTALDKEQMPWEQVWDQASEVAELYNVQGIPYVVLIDPDGKIVAIHLRGEQLEKKLQELF